MSSPHAATFELLGRTPRRSAAASERIARAEERLGSRLPASVRDWYSRQSALTILARHSNDDPPIPVDEFAVVDSPSGPVVPFRHENQGVCTWAFALEGDDPRVELEMEGRWQSSAASFSQSVYSAVWDHRRVVRQPFLVAAQNDPLTDAAANTLIGMYREEVRTSGWPEGTQRRFAGPDAHLLIWAGPDQADWWIGASDLAALESVLRAVWAIDGVGPSLYGCTGDVGDLLARIQGEGTSR